MPRNHLLTGVLLGVVVSLLVGVVAGPGLGRAVAQNAAAEPAVGSISVSGSSAIRVQPDRAVVVLGVQTFASTPAEAQAVNAAHMTQVRQAILSLGIAAGDIATADFWLYPEYADWDRKETVEGYYASNTIAVTLRDISQVEQVLVKALEAGATSVEGIEFSVTNLRQLRDQARAQAVQAALEKAQAMAGTAGMTIGQVTSINENSWSYYGGFSRRWTATQNVVQEPGGESAPLLEDGSISLGKISVQAEVSVSVEMRPAAP
jgi:uncharacterized protein YggE